METGYFKATMIYGLKDFHIGLGDFSFVLVLEVDHCAICDFVGRQELCQ